LQFLFLTDGTGVLFLSFLLLTNPGFMHLELASN
jgi:hypothetical protein